MPVTADTYQYTKNVPRRGFNDERIEPVHVLVAFFGSSDTAPATERATANIAKYT